MGSSKRCFAGHWGFGVLIAMLSAAVLPARGDNIKPEQLVGAWVRTNVADIAGMEFMQGGKTILYFGGASEGMTGDYSITADGRLNLGQGGLADFFVPSFVGDQLSLKSPDSGKVAMYRRLKPGETMAAAIAAQKVADAKFVQDRNRAIPAFLARNDLVMLMQNGGNNFPAASAIELAPNGSDFAGRIFYDSTPPRMDALGASIRPSQDAQNVLVWFGPGNAQQNRLSFSFHVVGSPDSMTLVSMVNLSKDGAFSTEANSTVVIKADAAMHQQILTHLKAEGARLEALKAPVVAMLKEYVVLKGTSQSQLPAERQGYADQFTLTRNPQNNTWVGQGQLINRTTGATEIVPAIAAVGIIKEKPAIQIMTQKRVYLFTEIDAASGKLTGGWQLPQNPNGRPAELTIVQATDTKGRDQLFAASKDALQKLTADTMFHALVSDQGNQPPNPVAVTLSAAANGSVTGKADYPLEGCSMKLSGRIVNTPLGPQLLVQYGGGEAGASARGDAKPFMDALQHEAWILSPAGDPAAGLRLEGTLIANTTQRSAPLSLQLLPYTDKDKAAVAQALGSGMKFRLINPKMGDVVDVLEFATDSSSGMIKGRLTTAGHQINNSPNSTFTGPISEELGWVKLVMPILRPIDRTPTYAYTIVATPTDGGIYISAGTYNIRQGLRGGMGRWDAIEVKQ